MARVRSERKGYDVIIYQQHVDRLKKMSPTVDSGPPREHPLSNKREMDKVIAHTFTVIRSWDFFLCKHISMCVFHSGENF